MEKGAIMKRLLLIFFFVLFNFSAVAEKKSKIPVLKDFFITKFSNERCVKIFNQADLIYKQMEKEYQNNNFKDIEFFQKKLVDISLIFNAFCKD